ncbi:DUF6265 family protein [Polluticoccus soli]|uniref:DUF6265 family protein n=1 Tax=Polluticoccus soli TaxID=3034150 RepID=UPI0023E17A27|nr:DUF6265 family protein [Flavipsychrobacter sp. JY13-12]
MKRLLPLLLPVLLLTACSDEIAQTASGTEEHVIDRRINNVRWMLGEWVKEMPNGVFVEKWQEETDTSYIGEGTFTTNNGDVMFSEKLRLEQRGDELWYIPTVANQNNAQPVLFKETKIVDNEAVFENPEHDFPQRIIYKRTSDSTLYARIEGKQGGQDAKEEFNFKKKNR